MSVATDVSAPAARDNLLEVRDVVQEFAVRGSGGIKEGTVKAVSGVSLEIKPGETFGIVGESGSGKSTLARAILQAPKPRSGDVIFEGENLSSLKGRALDAVRSHIGVVFQDPFASLDPRWKIAKIVEEPLVVNGIGDKQERRRRVAEVLDLVGLDVNRFGDRLPRGLSGGQCQRVAIARALTLAPKMLICDEPVSSLDVVVQAQVVNLFEELRKELELSYLFIAHDLTVVKQVSDRIAVMYLGKLCEVAPSEALYRAPRHPYTAALVASIPNADPYGGRVAIDNIIRGELPSPINPPSGCRFRTRCPRAQEKCALEEPQMVQLRPNHTVACHFPLAEGEAPPVKATPA